MKSALFNINSGTGREASMAYHHAHRQLAGFWITSRWLSLAGPFLAGLEVDQMNDVA